MGNIPKWCFNYTVLDVQDIYAFQIGMKLQVLHLRSPRGHEVAHILRQIGDFNFNPKYLTGQPRRYTNDRLWGQVFDFD